MVFAIWEYILSHCVCGINTFENILARYVWGFIDTIWNDTITVKSLI